MRVEYADGFGLARPSNTTPVIDVLRFEAENEAARSRIQADFRRALTRSKSGYRTAILIRLEAKTSVRITH
jgi:phosphomannomutase/phosphoglucomutase